MPLPSGHITRQRVGNADLIAIGNDVQARARVRLSAVAEANIHLSGDKLKSHLSLPYRQHLLELGSNESRLRILAEVSAAPALMPAEPEELLRARHALNVLARIMAGDNDEDADAIAPIYDRLEIELAEWEEGIPASSNNRLARVGPAPPRPKRKPWHKMGVAPVVYFFKSGDFIKIGKSTRWRTRLSTLQTGSPHPIVPLLVLPATPKAEQKMHRRFKRAKFRREWFRPSAEVLEFIEEHMAESLITEDSP